MLRIIERGGWLPTGHPPLVLYLGYLSALAALAADSLESADSAKSAELLL